MLEKYIVYFITVPCIDWSISLEKNNNQFNQMHIIPHRCEVVIL